MDDSQRGATGLRKTIDGVVRVDGPPYPRLRKKEAWPVLFVGSVDPTHWDMPTVDTSLAPLRRADPWLDGPGMTVLGLSALPTRHGPPAILGGKKGTKERRIVPEWLPVIKRHGVDAISFSGPVRSQFSPQTIQRAEDNIRALGLSAVSATTLTPTIFSYDVSDNQYTGALLSVQVPHESTDAFWSELRGVLTQLVQSTHSVLLDITVDEATTVEERLQHLSIEGVAGIAVIGGTAKPGVHIYNGVTHVYGLRELGMDHRLGLAVRWYLGAYGVQRIDLIGVGINSDGQLVRALEHESKGMFDALARNSVRFGTYVRPGKQIATVDVRGHVSHRKRDVGEAVIPTPMISVGFEEKTLPERCVGTAVKNPKVSYDSGLRLDSWALLKSTVKQGSPFVLELQWSVANASSTRPDTRIRLNAPFRPEPLRHQYQPCSGSWSLNDLSPRQVLREQIRFWPRKV